MTLETYRLLNDTGCFLVACSMILAIPAAALGIHGAGRPHAKLYGIPWKINVSVLLVSMIWMLFCMCFIGNPDYIDKPWNNKHGIVRMPQ